MTIRLFANGADTSETLVLNEANGWEGTFTGLNREKDGKEIEYTVKEDAVKGYETSISGNAEDGFTVVNTHEIQPVPAKTGDNSSPRLWLGIMSLCIAVIVVALLAKKIKASDRKACTNKIINRLICDFCLTASMPNKNRT